MINFDKWPDAPEQDRPKRLPHKGLITPDWERVLLGKGWNPIDVRTMPNETDHDRAEAVKATLEGVRLETIELDQKLYKFLELEARVYGLSTGKVVAKPKIHNMTNTAVDYVLDFGKTNPWSHTLAEKEVATKKRRGRPKKEE